MDLTIDQTIGYMKNNRLWLCMSLSLMALCLMSTSTWGQQAPSQPAKIETAHSGLHPLYQKRNPISQLAYPIHQKHHPLLVAGPLVGFANHHEVKLWIQTTQKVDLQIRYWPKGSPQYTLTTKVLHTQGKDVFTRQVLLTELKANTHYKYQVLINGKVVDFPHELRFETQMVWKRITSPPDFTFAMGSCAYLNTDPTDTYGHSTQIFDHIRQKKPDFMLWLGDMVYLKAQDWSSRHGIFRRYTQYRAHPDLQPLFASTHHYAIWDDHDYGPNDGNRSYIHKQDSLDAFKTFWPNPSYGLPQVAGNFTTFSWSDVDFFLLDNRSYRADNLAPDDADKDYLGAAQLEWLIDALSNSRATFKIVASGSQVLSPYAYFESYARHSHELNTLLKKIKDYKIEGVVFVSGDRHHSELNRLHDDPHFYPLYDFTSSPLTSGLARSAKNEAMNPRRVKGTFVYKEHNFALIKVVGRMPDRKLLLQNHNAHGKMLWQYEIKAKDLTIPKSPF